MAFLNYHHLRYFRAIAKEGTLTGAASRLGVSQSSISVQLRQLRAHTLDLVLSNLAVRRDVETPWHSHLLEEQTVALVGRKSRGRKSFRFPQDIEKEPLLLPTSDSAVRGAFDLVMERAGIRPVIAAEVDDMAMLRLLAREGAGLALVPPVVVAGELERGLLKVHHRFADIRENFYAITPSRRYPNPLVDELVGGFRKRDG